MNARFFLLARQEVPNEDIHFQRPRGFTEDGDFLTPPTEARCLIGRMEHLRDSCRIPDVLEGCVGFVLRKPRGMPVRRSRDLVKHVIQIPVHDTRLGPAGEGSALGCSAAKDDHVRPLLPTEIGDTIQVRHQGRI